MSDVKCSLEPGTYLHQGEIYKVLGVLDYMAFSIIEWESAPGCVSYKTFNGNITSWERI